MANFNEQILRAWDEWEQETGAEASNPDDFVTWAMEKKKFVPQLQDIRRLLRKQVATALRQATRMDDAGFSYRAKQCVTVMEEGLQLRLWFDTDISGTPNLRQKAVRQRRDGIANDVYRAVCDVEHMNKVFPGDPRLNFFPDFSEDIEEHRAAELASSDKDEEDAA
ncbi:MAG TPA: hypothetical protein VMA30_04915 [Xanthobacteraceae bacterium]|nr:hypothetical protein [Xanthobacteraceae bacterium]